MGTCGTDNDSDIGHGGSRKYTQGEVSRADVTRCQTMCDAATECNGFMWQDEKCYFRKDPTCATLPLAGYDCWRKEDVSINIAGTASVGRAGSGGSSAPLWELHAATLCGLSGVDDCDTDNDLKLATFTNRRGRTRTRNWEP